MEEKKTSLGIHTLIYGVGTGVALVVYTLIMYVANLYLSKTMQYVSFVVLIAGMVIGAIQYRKVALNGFMTYGQAFSVSFLIGLFATIVSIIFFFFYIKYINTGMLGELLEQARANIEAKGGNLSQEQMDQAMAMTEKFISPGWMVLLGFLGNAFWAAVFSLIIAIFLRKNDPNAPKMI
jgi:hypothetical protein